MPVRVQQRRSDTASKRPTNAILEGEVALNFNDGTPGAFFKNASGDIVKLGPAEVGAAAPNSSVPAGGSSGNSTGELWYDTTDGALKVFDGTAFQTASSGVLADGDTSVGVDGTTDTITLNTGGTDRWIVDANGHFVPAADSSYNLGASGTEIAAAFIDDLNVTTSADLLGQAPVRYYDADSSNFIAFAAPATVAADVTFTLPDSDGTADQVLTTDGAGTLSWSEARTNDLSQGDSSVVVTDTGTDGNIAFTTDGTTAWNINNNGDFVPGADSTFDLGTSANRVAEAYIDTLTLTNPLSPANGGTGLDGSSAANGQLLIGNGTGYTLSTLTGDQSITITNTAGGIEIDADFAQGATTSAAGNAGVASFQSNQFTVDAAGFVTLDLVAVEDGGTGVDGSAAANGELLIGNGAGFTLATITGDQSITVTNTAGGIEIDADFAQAAAASAAGNAGVASFDSADFAVDAAGFVQIAGTAAASTFLADDTNSATPNAGQLILSGDTGISTTASGNTIEIDLDDTAVTAASYGAADTISTFTVDQQGRLTAAADIAVAILHDAVTDFDAGVQTNRLDQMAAPTASVSFNSQTITDVADPVNDQDAATKLYVDTVAQGLDPKDAARAGTTGNITLSGTQTVDGVALVAGDRILVKDQTTQSENGIYEVAAGAWSRTEDADTWDKLVSAFIFVSEGTTNADSGFVMTADAGGTLGTTAVTWSQFSGAGQIEAGAGMTKTGNRLDVVGTANRIVVNADDIDIDANYVGQTSITTLGTIATGTWNADIIGLSYGGTGVDNTNIQDGFAFLSPAYVDGASPGNATFREILTTDVAPITGGSFDGGTF